MTCSRWHGCLIAEEVETEEGALRLERCVNCGERFEWVVNRHRRRRPVPRSIVSLPVNLPRKRTATQEDSVV
mgnify:CR=1 FL=1